METIKARAWVKKEKKFYPIIGLFFQDDKIKHWCSHDAVWREDGEVDFSTYMIDKNGQEIFENDLVKWRKTVNNETIDQGVGMVKYWKKYGCYIVVDDQSILVDFWNNKDNSFEKIGTLYQNSNFL